MKDTLQPIVDRISDFFHIFDTSYFIVGVFGTLVILGVIYFNVDFFDAYSFRNGIINFLKNLNFLQLFILSFVAYVNGIIFTIIGRFTRRNIFENCYLKKYSINNKSQFFNFKAQIDYLIFQSIYNYSLVSDFKVFISNNNIINNTSCDVEDFFQTYQFNPTNFFKYYNEENKYLKENRILYKYYTYIWTILRDNENYKVSNIHLNRKWVSCAKYDGLSGVFLSIAVLTLISNFKFDNEFNFYIIGFIFFSIFLSWRFIHEAMETYKYMVQDLMSTYSVYNKLENVS